VPAVVNLCAQAPSAGRTRSADARYAARPVSAAPVRRSVHRWWWAVPTGRTAASRAGSTAAFLGGSAGGGAPDIARSRRVSWWNGARRTVPDWNRALVQGRTSSAPEDRRRPRVIRDRAVTRTRPPSRRPIAGSSDRQLRANGPMHQSVLSAAAFEPARPQQHRGRATAHRAIVAAALSRVGGNRDSEVGLKRAAGMSW